MKKFTLIFCFLILNLGLFAQHDFKKHTCCKIAEQEAKAFQNKFNQPKAYLNYGYDIFYHKMKWEIDPGIYYIKGSVNTHFEATNNLDFIVFDMDELLQVDSVMYHGTSKPYTHLGDVLKITLGQTIPIGNTDSVIVYYQGAPDQGNGFGSFKQDVHGQPPKLIISTLSEPFGAKDWWPCKESLDDKIDSIDIIVTCPEEYRTASNGMLQSDVVVGGQRTMHWKHRYPVATYLIAIAVSNYVVYSDYSPLPNGDSLEILNYVFPESLAYAQTSTPITGDLIQLYSNLFMPYPFIDERYGHAMFTSGGGMEHQTMSFMTGFNFELTAHELAHQWFGDYVTCKNWHDIWLNEGFATYVQGLGYEFIVPQYWEPWLSQVIGSVTSQPDGAVYVDDTTSVLRIFDSRLSYRKGSMILHTLRWELGDSLFFQGMKDYLARPDLAFGYAESSDFIETMEATADTNLQGYFADWLYGEGYPIYQLEYNQDSLQTLHINLNQTTSHPSVSFFELHIPVLAVGTSEDTLLVMHHTSNNQQFDFQLDFHVNEIIFDPEYWIVTRDPVVIGIDEEVQAKDIRMFPNPASNMVSIEFKNSIRATEIETYNMRGKRIENIQIDSSYSSIMMDISAYPVGAYIISIQTNKGRISRRVIKE
ncbi:MAG: T9SS type A sorting domain-containing protein [Bacteroidales bacterium]|nr:T9SS type A sorting domain-containing protein [Bacteroidales bacterium]MCF8455261.1 T9SS type A sorting domain-containing protein [Bacteroidales bacterium]